MLTFPPSHDEIAACAYFIYLDEGCPAGRQEQHWRQAEEQLLADSIHDALLSLTSEMNRTGEGEEG